MLNCFETKTNRNSFSIVFRDENITQKTFLDLINKIVLFLIFFDCVCRSKMEN